MPKLKNIFKEYCLEMYNCIAIEEDGSTCRIIPDYKDEKYYYISINFDEKMHELVKLIYERDRDNFKTKSIGSDYYCKHIEEFLISLKKYPERLDKKINEFFEELKKAITGEEYHYILPVLIDGIILAEELTIGRITFFPYSNSVFRQKLTSITGDDSFFSPIYDYGHIHESSTSFVIQNIVSNCADTDRIIKKSYDDILEALNLLRMFSPKSKFGIKDTFLGKPIIRKELLYNLDIKEVNYEIKTHNASLIYPFYKEKHEVGTDPFFIKVCKILEKEPNDRTSFEMDIIDSINIIGEIYNDDDNAYNVVKIFIGLEILLIENNEKKGKNMAERMAYMLSDDKDKRLKTYLFVLEMYRERNNIVHEGKWKYLKHDYRMLLDYYRICIKLLVYYMDEISGKSELIDTIKQKKFEGSSIFQHVGS